MAFSAGSTSRISAVAQTLLFHLCEVGQLGRPDAVQLQQLPADLGADALWLLFPVVLHFDFEEQIRAVHRLAVSPTLYTKKMVCALCQVRRPKRFCPGVRGDICSICCGTEREITVACPLECEYLQDARRHDKPVPLKGVALPHEDIRISDKFLADHEELLLFLGHRLNLAALETPGVADFDVRETLEALIRTYRTLQSGVYYETRPDNAPAKALFGKVQSALAEFRAQEQQRLGMPRTRDADVLGMLVFLERLELDRNNGRRRGRAFIDFLGSLYPESRVSAGSASSPLVLP